MNKRPIVLVLNCGSSSVKYQVLDMTDESLLAKGLVERVGSEDAHVSHTKTGHTAKKYTKHLHDHKEAVAEVLGLLVDKELGCIEDVSDITAVGHRVVHAGEKFSATVKITDEAKATLRECIELAPLHNPANIIGIEAAEAAMPGTPQTGTFDTAFHQTMPARAYIYGLPYEYYQKYGIRRYGFHGTSHSYVSRRAADMIGKPAQSLKIITCHLGNGASIAAVDGGKSVDTSMGFTPLEGLVMGTRCGDIDPAIVKFLMDKEGLSPGEADDILNKKSGVLGIGGQSHDMRDIEEAAERGDARAQLALDVYCYRVRKYIGAYAAAMNGVDAIVFTAGIGENSSYLRKAVCESLTYLGLEFDADANNGPRGQELVISKRSSRVKVLVIPTNEELVIAREALRAINSN